MVRLRRQQSLLSLLIVAPVLGLVLAWVPWPASALLAALATLHWLVEIPRVSWIQWVAIYSVGGVLVGLMMPGVNTHSDRASIPAAAVGPGSASTSGTTDPHADGRAWP